MTNTLENLRGAELSSQTPDAGRSEAERPAASREDVAAFQRAMRGEDPKRDAALEARTREKSEDPRSNLRADDRPESLRGLSEKTGAKGEGDEARGSLTTDPNAQKAQDFLASLFRGIGAGAEGATRTAGPEGAAPAGAAPNEALETLVSRILVSRPESGQTEVRLQIQDAVLKNTEITLARDAGGQLAVRIHTTDAAAFQTIVSARAELEARLSGRETLPVIVELQKDTDREENDARHASRGRGLFDESAAG